MDSGERGMNPVAMTIYLNEKKEKCKHKKCSVVFSKWAMKPLLQPNNLNSLTLSQMANFRLFLTG